MNDEPEKQVRHKIPDPSGIIAKIRARLNPKCGIRLSPYCDVIISMRLQAVPFRDIEAWLMKQGDQFRLSAPTIFRNFKQAKVPVKLTYAEEMLGNLGGQVELDLVRELSQNIWTQKERIDMLVRAEKRKREATGSEGYVDKRIRAEMAVHNDMMSKLHTILSNAPKNAQTAEDLEVRKMEGQVFFTDDALSVLRDMILGGEIQVGPNDILPVKAK